MQGERRMAVTKNKTVASFASSCYNNNLIVIKETYIKQKNKWGVHTNGLRVS